MNGDLSKLVYMKDDDVYQKTDGMDKVKIASDVERVLKVYDTGEMYYLNQILFLSNLQILYGMIWRKKIKMQNGRQQ